MAKKKNHPNKDSNRKFPVIGKTNRMAVMDVRQNLKKNVKRRNG